MAWYDSQGRGWRNRRSDGWPTDDKAPDGFLCAGYRKVDRLQRVRFGGGYWTHPDLPIGRMVHVCWDALSDGYEARAHIGHPDACPDNIAEHISSFYDSRSSVRCVSLGDWSSRPVAH